MDSIIYLFGSALLVFLQALPLEWAARVGRFFGGLVYYAAGRQRRVAVKNLTMCFGAEKSQTEIRAIAKENFKRIGENFVCPIQLLTAAPSAIWERLEITGGERVLPHVKPGAERSIILAIGHFGNFEAFAQIRSRIPTHKLATTYRAFGNKAANRLLLKLRNHTDCLYFERRTEGAALRAALRGNTVLLGLLADQHSASSGIRLPFLGHDCQTSKAPAVFALRFNAPLYVSICYRTALARWRIEMGNEIPTRENGKPRSIADIMLDVNREFEAAVRRDPANWFWVHNRWKILNMKSSPRQPAPAQDEPEEQEMA
jgi:lauroyl/myristoyl acyltransferase